MRFGHVARDSCRICCSARKPARTGQKGFDFDAPMGETLATIARAVEAERHCCRFLRFGITVEPDGGPVFLELTGPAGTREFIGALLEV
jgi:hypothetical protein